MLVKEFITIIPFDDASQKHLVQELARAKNPSVIVTSLQSLARDLYDNREKTLSPEVTREIEKYVYLSTLDEKWMDHLDQMESLRDGIGLRGYAQRDPLVEYQQEAYTAFERLISRVEQGVVRKIYRLNPATPTPPKPMTLRKDEVQNGQVKPKTVTSSAPSAAGKLGRNDPCWCGSGKKWKKCHYPQTS